MAYELVVGDGPWSDCAYALLNRRRLTRGERDAQKRGVENVYRGDDDWPLSSRAPRHVPRSLRSSPEVEPKLNLFTPADRTRLPIPGGYRNPISCFPAAAKTRV